MSVTLISSPPAISFSGDNLIAEFSCTDLFSQVGVKSINKITLSDPVYPGQAIEIKYGGKTVIMTAGAIDDSGTGFFATLYFPVTPEAQLQCFKDNWQLSQDFNMSIEGNELTLTAKRTGTIYNIIGYNATSGAVETIRPNYGIQFRLFCENAANTAYELLGETLINVQVGTSIKAEAPFGDKLHTYIGDEIRKNLPDMPTNAQLCPKSCRRYYFEYAETLVTKFGKCPDRK